MIEIEDVKGLSMNGAIIPKLKSGEVTSTEVDLSGVSDIEKIEYNKVLRKLNQWAAPEYSKLDSDYFYSEKQCGYYRCNFRKSERELETENELDKKFEGMVRNITSIPLPRYILNLLRDYYVLGVLLVILCYFGLDYFIDVQAMFKSIKDNWFSL